MSNRRNFLKTFSAAGTSLLLTSFREEEKTLQKRAVPPHLSAYGKLYAKDPKAASLAWFREARYGLFMHYGLYSIWGRGAWVQLLEQVPLPEYKKLMSSFTADQFDADFITDLALEAGMKYVNITTKHHDGFCLFRSAETDYTSLHAAAGRDLVGELNDACRKKGLGLFLYYSVAADWHHPYFPAISAGWQYYRPPYSAPEPAYLYKSEKDVDKYIDYVKAQVRELVRNYDPAGIWFDPIRGYYARPDLFPMDEIYAEIRKLSPHALISFKQGATGREDFAAPERKASSLADSIRSEFGENAASVAAKSWSAHQNKHNETCSTMQRGAWSYEPEDNDRRRHLGSDEVIELLKDAESRHMNLLMNTGPLPGGSIHTGDAATLREVGKRIRS